MSEAGGRYVIGVTGHRSLPDEDIPELAAAVEAFYAKVIINRGRAGVSVLSSLAEGADTLCAEIALSAGFRLAAPLPLAVPEYREDFSAETVPAFDYYLSRASEVFAVSPLEPVPENRPRGFFYRQAAVYVVRNSDILLALWDGLEKRTPDGAGTWETIKLARKNALPIHIVSIKKKALAARK